MEDRKKQREDYSKRGTIQAAKRMQIIAELGKEEKNNENDDGNTKRNLDQSKDTFGMDDNDWNVYKDIQKNNFSEDEEDDQQLLNDLEEKLTELDSEFNQILYQVGPSGHQRPVQAEDFQIRLWADRYRGSEILFQPSIVGLECAGLTEAIETIFSQLSRDQLKRMLGNVVILGGNSKVPGFDSRIEKELRMMTPSDLQINIQNNIQNRELQPWLGAKKLANLWQ